MTPISGPARAAQPGLPAHARHDPIGHPLIAAARAESLSGAHLAVAVGSPPLPLLVSRAEIRPTESRAGTPLVFRIGLMVDARGLPGRRHALRGALLLRVDADAAARIDAEVVGLEWQAATGAGWSRVPTPAAAADRARFGGRAAQVAAAIEAWAMTPAAEPALAACLRAGAAVLERSAVGFDSDAALHELDCARPDAGAAHRRRGMGWAARQRGMAAQQRRNAGVLQRLAATLTTPPDLAAEAALLATAAAAAARQDAARAKAAAAARRAADSRAAARAPTRRQDGVARARPNAAAARLISALDGLLAAVESRGDLAPAVARAQAVLAEARTGAACPPPAMGVAARAGSGAMGVAARAGSGATGAADSAGSGAAEWPPAGRDG